MSNIRDTSFTVSWVTDVVVGGYIEFGEASSLGETAEDLRGENHSGETHYVQMLSLKPDTLYYFDIVSGNSRDDNGGQHYTLQTGPTLSIPGTDTAYGQVMRSDASTPAEDAIVFITLQDGDGADSPGEAGLLSSLVDANGYWFTNLADARTIDLAGYFDFSAAGDTVYLFAQGASEGTACAYVDTSVDAPAMTINLGDGCVDPNSPPHTPNSPNPTDGATGVDILTPLAWEGGDPDVGDTVNYDVYLAADQSPPSLLVCENASITNCTPGALNYSTHYYWYVVATDNHGKTETGSVWDFWTESEPLPGSFNKTSPSHGAVELPTTVTLVWQSSVGATSYEYCYDTSNDNACSTWTNVGSSTSVVLSSLGNGVTYYWQVRANNASGTAYANGSSTAFWDFTTDSVSGDPKINVDPQSLTSLQATDIILATTVTISNIGTSPLNWSAIEDAQTAVFPTFQVGFAGSMVNTSLDASDTASIGSSFATLWNQTDFGSGSCTSSQSFPDFGNSVLPAADDFLVSDAAGWTIDIVFVNGIYSTDDGPSPTRTVAIYADGVSGPDSVVYTATNIIADSDVNGDITLSLDNPAYLPQGTYWISVMAEMEFGTNTEQFYWCRRTTQNLDSFHFQDPADLLALGCTSWAPGAACIEAPDPDLLFSLGGVVGGSGEACDSTVDISWLSISPTSGTILPQESSSFTATFDSGGLDIGTYEGQICISSDDPDTPLVVVPISLEVTATAGDDHEPDNSWDQAAVISDGVPQNHSIAPVGDEDWIKFTLSEESEIVLESAGLTGDTRMWLYDGNLNLIEFNDDDGTGLFSLIGRECGVDALVAGTYYVQIDEFNDNDEIASYEISMSIVQSCLPGSDNFYIFLPIAWRND